MKSLIVSNMFPSKKYPTAGIFVKRFCGELDKIGVPYDLSVMYWQPNKFKKLLSYAFFISVTFLKILVRRYDVVYIHYASHSSIPVLAASKFKRLTIVTNVHGSDVVPESAKQENFQKYTRAILNLSRNVVVPSEYFAEYVAKKYSCNAAKIIVYPSGGVDRTIFSQLSSSRILTIKKQLGFNPQKKVFSYIGRITAGKGWDTYLRAVSILVQKGYDAEFVLAGDGIQTAQYDQLVLELKLTNIIKKFPLLDQEKLVKMYNCSEAFIFPTEREGESLGLVAIEAMSCGTPVISSDVAAPRYYVENGYNGYKFEKGNVKELADLIAGFINETYQKKQFEKGVNETADNYRNEKAAAVLSELFREIRHE